MEENYSKKEIGLRLKEFRLSMHMTQKEFANSIHCEENTYRKIETGVSLLTTDRAQMLHQVYHLDINYILTGEKKNPERVMVDVWVTATPEEKSQMLGYLFEYWKKMLIG